MTKSIDEKKKKKQDSKWTTVKKAFAKADINQL